MRPSSLYSAGSWLGAGLLGLSLLCFAGRPAAASEPPPPRLYDMTTQTGMPHLEENLRYALVREKRCLNRRDLPSAFWILKHESLQDCRLEKAAEQDDAETYVLLCDAGHGTTGDARWEFGADQISGTLNVRLGGKNMTFYQRIIAKPVGECPGR